MTDPVATNYDWRETLTPPPGGLRRLAAAIERPSRRLAGIARIAVACGTAAAGVVIVPAISARWQGIHFEHRARERFVQALAAPPPVFVDNGVAVQIANDDSNVRFYWIAQTAAADKFAPGHE